MLRYIATCSPRRSRTSSQVSSARDTSLSRKFGLRRVSAPAAVAQYAPSAACCSPVPPRENSLSGVCQGPAELAARRDAELLVGVLEVPLDRLHGHEQGFGDLSVRHSLGRQPGDLALARGQRLEALHGRPAWPGAGRGGLAHGASRQLSRAKALGEVEPAPQRVTRVATASRAPQGGAVVDQRPRPLQGGLRLLRLPDGLLERLEPRGAALYGGERPQGVADHAGRAEALGERQLLLDEGQSLLAIA